MPDMKSTSAFENGGMPWFAFARSAGDMPPWFTTGGGLADCAPATDAPASAPVSAPVDANVRSNIPTRMRHRPLEFMRRTYVRRDGERQPTGRVVGGRSLVRGSPFLVSGRRDCVVGSKPHANCAEPPTMNP